MSRSWQTAIDKAVASDGKSDAAADSFAEWRKMRNFAAQKKNNFLILI